MDENRLRCHYCGALIKSHESEVGGVYGGIDFRVQQICCWNCCGHHEQWKKDIEEWERKKEEAK